MVAHGLRGGEAADGCECVQWAGVGRFGDVLGDGRRVRVGDRSRVGMYEGEEQQRCRQGGFAGCREHSGGDKRVKCAAPETNAGTGESSAARVTLDRSRSPFLYHMDRGRRWTVSFAFPAVGKGRARRVQRAVGGVEKAAGNDSMGGRYR
jgi:hypothetical protein